MEHSQEELLTRIADQQAGIIEAQRQILSIIDPPDPAEESLYWYCIRQAAAGNKKPLDTYLKRTGGKLPNVQLPPKTRRRRTEKNGCKDRA